jgi:hypothetical protein
MKRGLIYTVLLAGILMLAMAGCTPPGSSTPPEFAGTWLGTNIFGTETWVLSGGSASASDTGTFAGTSNWSVASSDTVVKHIKLTLTYATGAWALFYTTGSSLYMTYAVSGTTLYLDYSPSSYPATATSVYTKQ